jgi:hypothetical protein
MPAVQLMPAGASAVRPSTSASKASTGRHSVRPRTRRASILLRAWCASFRALASYPHRRARCAAGEQRPAVALNPLRWCLLPPRAVSPRRLRRSDRAARRQGSPPPPPHASLGVIGSLSTGATATHLIASTIRDGALQAVPAAPAQRARHAARQRPAPDARDRRPSPAVASAGAAEHTVPRHLRADASHGSRRLSPPRRRWCLHRRRLQPTADAPPATARRPVKSGAVRRCLLRAILATPQSCPP